MQEVLYQFNPWWEKEIDFDYVIREKYFDEILAYLEKHLVLFITGLRRIGKTTLMKQSIKYLIEERFKRNHILYISCEHPAFEKNTLLEIVDEFRNIHNITSEEEVFLFFDEVHLKNNFERDLKILHDMNENMHIICSGSSASLLRDKKAYLTGRHHTIEVNPLTFEEFLKFKNINIKPSEEFLYKNAFKQYMYTGGIPEYVIHNDTNYILELFESIIYKDIVSLHKIKNLILLKELFLLLCERSGKILSYSKLARVLKTTTDTIISYINLLESNYLIHIVYKYEKSLNAKMSSQKKIYICDVGIRNVLIGFKDKGAIFENLVYLVIKNQSPEYYQDNKREVDFILPKKKIAIEAKFKQNITEYDKEGIIEVPMHYKFVVTDYRFFLNKNSEYNIVHE